ncbi:septation protein SepH [Quadrisphaera sp. DSM 44207]|uniref:septation protein SepH n=1 Tax=Quadrisphaera sp. DSM 44207 TaxID=1881057 RepID=UPI000883CFA8|nr:septation protein SepH [Quadrisphaera sp. DSM 44207]SDQ50330.1 Protein of unknown function [Quadrisphaera sp. DSM 44207]
MRDGGEDDPVRAQQAMQQPHQQPGQQAPQQPGRQGGGSSDPQVLALVSEGHGPSGAPQLVLAAPDGTRFVLSVDAAVRAAVRRAGPMTAPVPQVREPLRPRDIQARIRAGETAEEVAESSGVPVDQVRRYEGPVLAERAHVAALAREAHVRSTASASRPVLDDLVRQRLAARGVDAAVAVWDAWRREDAWAVQVSFSAGGRERAAQWSFDPASTVLEPLDDEARWLSSAQDPDTATGRRLSAVRVYDVETDGGVREVPVVPAPPLLPDVAPPDDVAARTMELLDALRERRGRRVPLMDLETPDEEWEGEEDDDLVSALLDLPPAAHPPASSPEEAVDAGVLPASEPRLRAVPWQPDPSTPATDEVPAAPSPGERAPAAPEPAWEDIVAGPREHPRPAGPPPLAPPPAAPAAAVPPAPAAPAAREEAPRTADPVRPRPGRADLRADTGRFAARTDGERPDPRTDTGRVERVEQDGVDEQGRPAPRARNRRSSVPSWDEIVFGSPKTD